VILRWIGTGSSLLAKSARNLSVALPSAVASGNLAIDILTSCCFEFSDSRAATFYFSIINYLLISFFFSLTLLSFSFCCYFFSSETSTIALSAFLAASCSYDFLLSSY
jgi:hypothetical protein